MKHEVEWYERVEKARCSMKREYTIKEKKNRK